ncbi:hypothetical protein ACFYUY_25795 [Kitasatospora sp. NPDC004745]|uniref:hypothetical protein n=1 Tax=unclassified Kitasatospora TaxID=2633591 RepID=UPI00368751F4
MRTALAALLGLAGAAGLVLSSFQPWYGKSDPRSVPVADLFRGMSPTRTTSTAMSMFLLLALAAGIAVVALLVRSRPGLLLACVVGVVTGVLWVYQKGRELSPVSLDVTDLDNGFWNACGGALAILLAVALLPPKRV